MIVTIDLETAYSAEYSLSRMSTTAYILSPLFETLMCAIKIDDGPTVVYVGHDKVAAALAKIDWSKAALCSHNTVFDGSILAWHYGIVPKLYLDTLSMARATTHAVAKRSSLAAVAKYLGLPPKGDEVVRAQGKWLKDFSPAELDAYAAYCVHDTDLCRAIFKELRRAVPAAEIKLIDTVVRMHCCPQVMLDANVLAAHLGQVRADKAQIMAHVAHIDKDVFSSNLKFAALLQFHGVDVPRKISPTTHMEMWALAKNDRAFKELCEDGDQPLEVQALLAARLNSKSTIEETRTAALLGLSQQTWPDGAVGWCPVPLKYYGAHTGRLSGDGGLNFQNFKRESPIRAGIVAPPGYRIIHRDSSQIEARMVAVLARCERLVTAFAEGRDVYSEYASMLYHRRVTRADKEARFAGKVSLLQLQYQTGPAKLRHTLFIGNGGVSVNVDETEAKRMVYAYRETYQEIPALWEKGEAVLWRMRTMRSEPKVASLIHTYPVIEYDERAIWLPNGMAIQYPNLRMEARSPAGPKEIIFDTPRGPKNIYGGAVLENVSQALARIVVTDIARRVADKTGYHPFLSTHDSLDYCVPEGQAKDMDALLEYEFSIPPTWAPNLPLASEGGWGVSLMDAEKMENL